MMIFDCCNEWVIENYKNQARYHFGQLENCEALETATSTCFRAGVFAMPEKFRRFRAHESFVVYQQASSTVGRYDI